MQKQKLTLATFVDLTRFEMSLIGLPFVLAGALLPFAKFSFIISFGLKEFIHALWIIPAFLSARISGMAFNQLIDRLIDKKNPRTSGRALPSGRATAAQAKLIAWSFLALFVLICSQINGLCFFLSLPAAILIYLYSYLKRYTVYCHFALGMIHLLSPVMASVALSGEVSVAPLFLGMAALLSIAGNDIMWALQDFHFDKKHHLHSIPARFGIKKSIKISLLLHISCVAMLLLVGLLANLSMIYLGAPLMAFLLFIDFHQKVQKLIYQPTEIEKISPLFFRCNVSLSLFTLLFIFLGVLWAV